MGSAPIRLFTLILAIVMLGTSRAEPKDTSIVYIKNDPSDEQSKVTIEYHARTNGLGRLIYDSQQLLGQNETFVDPDIGMPALGCVNAGFRCSWEKNGWRSEYHNITSSLLQLASGVTDNVIGTADACTINNGGCQHTCLNNRGVAVCSCPTGYLLNTAGGCRYTGSCGSYLYGTQGSFTSPNHPYSYPNRATCKWLLVAPPGYIIQLKFLTFRTESNADKVALYDGDSDSRTQLRVYSGWQSSSVTNSSGNQMLVTFNTDGSVVQTGFRAMFDAIHVPKKSDYVLKLYEDEGTLSSLPVVPNSTSLCLSIIYKLASDSKHDIMVSAGLATGQTFNLSSTSLTMREGWSVNKLKTKLPHEYLGHSVVFSVSVSGNNSTIYSIAGCNPYDDHEDVYVLSESVSTHLMKTPVDYYKDQVQGCNNGIPMDTVSRKCNCFVGFSGDTCEKGCGPNRYGNDCGGVCSRFTRGCKGMIFCKEGLHCTCAPGFKGKHCNIECAKGEYGNGCRNKCGHCRNDTCDPFTGACPDTCQDGYYPPLCHRTYKILAEPPTVVAKTYSTVTIRTNISHTNGEGSTKFYQIQYKDSIASPWLKLQPELGSTNLVSGNITALKSGFQYKVRVVLIDRDGNSYQNREIPETYFDTPCKVPDSINYSVQSVNLTNSSFGVTWKYDPLDTTWCPIKAFEVCLHERWRRLCRRLSAGSHQVSFSNLRPGHAFHMVMRAHTEHGLAPLSRPLHVVTSDGAPGKVVDLKVVPVGVGQLSATWNSPRITGGSIRRYRVEYQCLRLLACSESCNRSAAYLSLSSTSVVLSGLMPHAQYSVKVAGQSAIMGPYTVVVMATDNSGSSVAPDASPKPVTQLSNTTLGVQWMPPSNCTGLNGFLLGYRYQLVDVTQVGHVVHTGTTSNTYASFTDLKPHTQYTVTVSIITSGGLISDRSLVINATTRATIPQEVRNLTVYKKGRRMIGIRWLPPLKTYGPLKSFTVSHRMAGDVADTDIHKTIPLVQCAAWKEYYCHTINELLPDTEYIVSVSSRNTEVDIDGASASVTAETREGTPGVPTDLHVTNQSQDTLVVEWKLPNMLNGVLRAFLVNVEETEYVNASDCCEYFPVQELPVRSEDEQYRVEVHGLRPASTLTISVSAKTVTMGSSANITASTRPEKPVLLHAPQVVLPTAYVKQPYSVTIQPVQEHPGLKSTYLLLVLPSGNTSMATIWEDDLSDQLDRIVGQGFYLVGEYQREVLLNGRQVLFGTNAPSVNGALGVLEDPALIVGEVYRVGVALVQDYCSVKNVAFLASESFVAV